MSLAIVVVESKLSTLFLSSLLLLCRQNSTLVICRCSRERKKSHHRSPCHFIQHSIAALVGYRRRVEKKIRKSHKCRQSCQRCARSMLPLNTSIWARQEIDLKTSFVFIVSSDEKHVRFQIENRLSSAIEADGTLLLPAWASTICALSRLIILNCFHLPPHNNISHSQYDWILRAYSSGV